MEDCLFCKIYREKTEVIYENEFFYSRFDRFPVTPGHAEVIPKRHVISLIDLTEKEWNHLKSAIHETIKIIESTSFNNLYKNMLEKPINEKAKDFIKRALKLPYIDQKPEAYNHGNNDGDAAGRTINHFHWHIIPRYSGDVSNPTGGIRNIIPNAGNYKT